MGLLYCANHATAASVKDRVKFVSQLQQFSFLLHSALGRLYVILHSQASQFEISEPTDDISRSAPTLTASTDPDIITHLKPHRDDFNPSSDDELHSPRITQEFRALPPSLSTGSHRVTSDTEDSPRRLLSEQSGLGRIAIKKDAVLLLEKMMGRRLPELEMESEAKTSVWRWFVGGEKGVGSPNNGKRTGVALAGLKKKGKDSVATGTFGVPLATLVHDFGVESQFMEGNFSVRIPRFVELCLQSMCSMDLSSEGIFRKNGNIRRLKEAAQLFDQNPNLEALNEANVIQVAALLKKFFRDMPDPLLTFKLHFLFIASQNFDDLPTRKRILHLALCLLPKPNLDLLLVLLHFLRRVARFHESNKMDIPNLATVMTPNILYGRSRNPGDDQPFLCIRAVQMLIVYQDEFRTIPDEINVSVE
ncbi:hypothetical protein HDU98_002046 [Podochytrium sp. JEL0797]|nr:hypothetical protein HDU98_002046 [Podochytrium sp. JEL0797]